MFNLGLYFETLNLAKTKVLLKLGLNDLWFGLKRGDFFYCITRYQPYKNFTILKWFYYQLWIFNGFVDTCSIL